MNQQRRAQRLLGNSILVVAEALAGVVVAFLVTPILLNQLGIEKYGIWVIVSGLIGYIRLIQVDVMSGTSRFIAFHAPRNELDVVRNIIAFSSGWGDGMYPSYLALDGSGRPVAVVTDFQVLDQTSS